MKAFLITTLAFLAITLTSKAQWTVPGTNINNTNTGNVGIGTTSPNAKLETQATTEQLRLSFDATHFSSFTTSSTGNLAVQTGIITFNLSQYLNLISNGNTGLIVDAPTGSGSYTRMRVGTTGSISDFSINSGAGSTNNLRFVDNKTTTTVMTLASNDYVGIGTTSPAAALDILGATATTGLRSLNAAALGTTSGGGLLAATPAIPTAADQRLGLIGFGGIYFGSTYRYPSQIASFSSETWSSTATGSYLTFGTSASGTVTSTERMRIDNAGNVGIGTTNPAAKLDVNGGQRLNGDLAFATDATAYFIHGPANGGAIRIRSNGLTANDRNIQFGSIDNNGTWASYMIVDQTGNVGIGTMIPDQKLAVNGTIHSKAVLVDLTGWSDFVFKPAYKLPSLAEVKTYIDKNHHLPDVPSAADVEKNGINLGEMNRILLQKVEELTLYLMEQKQEMEKLKKEVEQLKHKQ